jgi:hypothetical protein
MNIKQLYKNYLIIFEFDSSGKFGKIGKNENGYGYPIPFTLDQFENEIKKNKILLQKVSEYKY